MGIPQSHHSGRLEGLRPDEVPLAPTFEFTGLRGFSPGPVE